jgi:hypothetical protein
MRAMSRIGRAGQGSLSLKPGRQGVREEAPRLALSSMRVGNDLAPQHSPALQKKESAETPFLPSSRLDSQTVSQPASPTFRQKKNCHLRQNNESDEIENIRHHHTKAANPPYTCRRTTHTHKQSRADNLQLPRSNSGSGASSAQRALHA